MMKKEIIHEPFTTNLATLFRISIVLLLALSFTKIYAQVGPAKYYIQFTDKANSPYNVNQPLQFLSQRAIDRRSAHNIPITEQDFPVNPQYIDSILSLGTIEFQVQVKWFNGIIIRTTDTVALQNIWALDFVDSANSMRNHPIIESGLKSDKMDVEITGSGTYQAGAASNSRSVLDYGLSENQIEMINLDFLHDMGYTGQGMVIAILDAGFRGADTVDILQHLWANGQILGAVDMVEGGIPLDISGHSGHGTFVLDCIAAKKPGTYIGTAPDADYWLLRTEVGFTEFIVEEYYWVAGAAFADSAGADVFSTSLGYTTFDDSLTSHTYEDMDGNTAPITIGADIAASKGILVVNSAGNSGSNPWHYISAPADGDSVLAIGAVDSNRVFAPFSSYGPTYDGRVKPNVATQGFHVPIPISADSVLYIAGTSFSGPIAAGAAACLWQAMPTMGNMDIYHAIELSADRSSNPDSLTGFGIPNFGMAYFSLTGIEDVGGISTRTNVYPNPATDIVVMNVPGEFKSAWEVRIYNLQGQLVQQHRQTSSMNLILTIDVASLPQGSYLIEAVNENNTVNSQFVKY